MPPDPSLALATFLGDIALVADVDTMEDGAPAAVTLITLHAAKGLEFPAVFLIGMEDGILPHQRSFDDPAAMEEERRLCYVGLTRAQRWLYCLYAFRRALMGQSGHNPPSRYLTDLLDAPGGDGHPPLIDRRGRAIDTHSADVRPARNRWLTWDQMDTAPADTRTVRPERSPSRGEPVPSEAEGSRDGVEGRSRGARTADSSTPSPHDRVRPTPPSAHPEPVEGRARRGGDSDRYDGIDPDPDAILGAANVPQPGARVRHQAFGLGTVVAVRPSGSPSGRGQDHELTVDFQDAGIKKLLLSLAPLEPA